MVVSAARVEVMDLVAGLGVSVFVETAFEMCRYELQKLVADAGDDARLDGRSAQEVAACTTDNDLAKASRRNV